MSSPFTTIEEFNGVLDGPTEGAIYTFANTPIINVLALLVSVGLFIWFIVATFTTHAEMPTVNKSIDRLSSFIIIGLLSLVAADFRQPSNGDHTTAEAENRTAPALTSSPNSARRSVPLGLLGMASIGLPGLRKSKKKGRAFRKQRASRNYLR